jgi:hypothetical protein
MAGVHVHSWRRYVGLALVTASILALQITFTRVFSIMIWHHFTYLIIGVALLGGGASGTFLAVRGWSAATLERRLGRLVIGYSLMVLLNLAIIGGIAIDPLRGSQIVQTLIGLAIYFVGLFTTFFLGGVIVSGVFTIWHKEAHRLYFADMLGAGAATLAVVWVIQAIGGPATIAATALLTLAGSLLFGVGLTRPWRIGAVALGVGQGGLIVWLILGSPLHLPVPGSKELGWAQQHFDARPEYTRWNPVGRVDVLPTIQVKEPMIVGGISRVYLASDAFQQAPLYDLKLVTLDGTSMTGMYRFDGTDQDLQRFRFLDHAIISAPYQLGLKHDTTLKIGVGGGLDILLARLYGAKQITAIELNADVVKLLEGPYREFSGNLAGHPSTRIIVAEGRSFLTRDTSTYDLIQGIGLDNLVALSGGAYVLSESYLYTVDSFALVLNRLNPEGVFAWTRNVDQPPREMLRITGLAAEALRQRGVADPAAHIAIVANDTNTQATLLVSPSPFSPQAIERLRAWARTNAFIMLHDPLERLDTTYAEYLHAPDPRAFEASYQFNIFPVTDDNPFFYNYFRWDHVAFNQAFSGKINRFPIGNLILITMAVFSLASAAAFIIAPLWRHNRRGLQLPLARPMLVYFSALGIGYIFVQIVLIQRFTLFIGYPTSAITTTIFSMLIFSAAGSLLSRRLIDSAARLRAMLIGVAVAIGIYIVALPSLFQSFLHLPDSVRMALSVLMIAPLALIMGMPFPTGLRQLGMHGATLVPWAWGMNGVFSVVGSTLVIIISMASTFTMAMACAALFYAIAAFVAAGLYRREAVQTAAAVNMSPL